VTPGLEMEQHRNLSRGADALEAIASNLARISETLKQIRDQAGENKTRLTHDPLDKELLGEEPS
jgi:hypothetical protein